MEVLHPVALVVVDVPDLLVLVEIGEILEELVVAEQEIHLLSVLLKDKMEDQVQEIIQVAAVVVPVQLAAIAQAIQLQEMEALVVI